MSMYALRDAVDADYESLYALHVATMRDAVAATWGWDAAVQQAMFRERWDASDRQIIVVDGEDAGVLAITTTDGEVVIDLIEVDPRHQRRGIGSAVIRDVLAEAHGRGVPAGLAVLKANPAAKRLYERLGFAVREERADRYIMRCAPPA